MLKPTAVIIIFIIRINARPRLGRVYRPTTSTFLLFLLLMRRGMPLRFPIRISRVIVGASWSSSWMLIFENLRDACLTYNIICVGGMEEGVYGLKRRRSEK
ncbi:MAG: hypothetical protein JOS17DRAFT_736256 [Linnemannia elongata]|nr:MAG: hypothetical protein JOS17DRAFT_736256 [Linnemannia elongata]